METKNEILLPKEFKKRELTSVGFGDMEEILGYCQSCMKRQDCRLKKNLCSAMGNDYEYWSDRFVAVDVPTPYKDFKDSEMKVFCADYESPQLKLQGIPRKLSDGVESLIETVEREKSEYLNIINESDLEEHFF